MSISTFSANISSTPQEIHQRAGLRTGGVLSTETDGNGGANVAFPSLAVEGGKVIAKDHVEPGTRAAVILGFIVGLIGFALGTLASYGIFLVVALLYPLSAWSQRRKATALIHGSGIRVSEDQFPEIHRCVTELKERLDLRKDVQVYIVESKAINASAMSFGRRNVVLLTNELIHGSLASGHPQSLAFVIGHELAHIALNHTAPLRSWMARSSKKLRRMDEYSADSVATALMGDRTIAFHGVLLLTVGHALLPHVNLASIIRQAQEVAADKYSKKAEKPLTHPLLLNRLQRILKA